MNISDLTNAVRHAAENGCSDTELQSILSTALYNEREEYLSLLTEKWHKGEGHGQTLAQYLGMSECQYSEYVTSCEIPPAL